MPLLEARPEHGPAFYLFFLASTACRLTALYQDLALGADPIYAGATEDGAERMGRHRTNLAGARGLPLQGLFVSILPMTSEAEAYYRERLFQQRNRICYCQPGLAGLGSRRQGTVRERGQRPSRFDCIHPRPWAPRATRAEKAAARTALASFVADPTRPRGLWTPLLPVPAGSDQAA